MDRQKLSGMHIGPFVWYAWCMRPVEETYLMATRVDFTRED